MNESTIDKIDTFKMKNVLENFPNQVNEAIEIGLTAPYLKVKNPNNWLLIGMGGSAIGGELLQSILRNSEFNEIRIFVSKNYKPYLEINNEMNVIISSYSGNTEETLESFEYAKQFTKNIIGITSGGRLEELFATEGLPLIKIPSGFQPRAAIGFSVFPLLFSILKSKLNGSLPNTFLEKAKHLVEFLNQKSEIYSSLSEQNPALELAKKSHNKAIFIYACEETLFPLANRFRAQIQENAKNIASSHFIPEMCHNEINSFLYPKEILQNILIVLISDPLDFPRNKRRIEALSSILSLKAEVVELQSKENNFLFRLFDLLYLTDWWSYYLAILNQVDPTSIPIITELKNKMQGN